MARGLGGVARLSRLCRPRERARAEGRGRTPSLRGPLNAVFAEGAFAEVFGASATGAVTTAWALHFGASFALASVGYAGGAALSREPVVRLGVGATVAMGAGIAKEMADRSGGDPSLKDLTWDALGTATGLVTAWLVDHFLLSRDRR